MNDIADSLQKRKKRTHSHLCSEKGIAPIMIDIDRINSTVDQQKKNYTRKRYDFVLTMDLYCHCFKNRIDTFAKLHRRHSWWGWWGWSHRGWVIVSLIIKQNKNPTVNIAAGSSVGSVALAATSLNPAGAAAGAATRKANVRLCWYPTDNKVERTEKKFFDIN